MANKSSESANRGKKGIKHQWTPQEDEKLVECLLDLAVMWECY
jgi:hypothetical protein